MGPVFNLFAYSRKSGGIGSPNRKLRRKADWTLVNRTPFSSKPTISEKSVVFGVGGSKTHV